MKQRVVFLMCFLVGLSIWILILSKRPKHRGTNGKLSDVCEISPDYAENALQQSVQVYPGGLKQAHLLVLEITRLKIKLEFLYYNFNLSGVQNLDDLLMGSGGTPVRSLIVSSWRSGSSFLGDLVNVMSSNFYHYEPLVKFGMTQIRGAPYANESINYLKKLFQCDWKAMETYIRFLKSYLRTEIFRNSNPMENNRRLWNICAIKEDLCWNSFMVAMICRLFPFQSMNVVRLRLTLVKDILEDKELNVKVVLLIRDPRAVIEARRRVQPACSRPDCAAPAVLCRDMVSDYVAAQTFARKYPSRFMVVRYEDLMLNVDVIGLQIVKFLGLGPTGSFREYLKKNGDMGLAITKHSVNKWTTDMDFDSVAEIQEECKDAMKLWDYELARNASHMKSRNFYSPQRHSVFPLPIDDDDFDGTFNM